MTGVLGSPAAPFLPPAPKAPEDSDDSDDADAPDAPLPILAAVERQHILAVLEHTGGNRTQAARILEISHPSLLSKIKAYDVTL